jgi:hypothetical protein
MIPGARNEQADKRIKSIIDAKKSGDAMLAQTVEVNLPTERMHVDLQSDEYNQKFQQAELFVKTAPVVVEEITADGLASGAYAAKGVVKNEDGQYMLSTMVVNQHLDDNGNTLRVPEVETTATVEPGFFIVTNPVWHEGEPRNHFVRKSAEDIDRLYENAGDDTLDGYSFGEDDLPGTVMRPRGYSEGTITPRPVIQNDTGSLVETNAPWGGTIDGNFDCYFAQDGAPENRYFLSQNDFAGYIPYSQYQQQQATT